MDHHAGDHLMGAAGKLQQHAQGILPIRGFAKKSAVHPDDGICRNDGFVRKLVGDRPGFAGGIFKGELRRRKRVVLELIRAGNNADDLKPRLFQKIFPAGGGGRQNDSSLHPRSVAAAVEAVAAPDPFEALAHLAR